MAIKNDPEINRKLLEILDELIADSCWDKSLFLKASSKEWINLREKLANQLDCDSSSDPTLFQKSAHLNSAIEKIPKDKLQVYVGLYLNDGTKLPSWERSMANLIEKSSSRPIYQDEVKAKDAMAKQGNSPNIAYIEVLINKSDIVPMPEKLVTDRFGHELLTLREDALRLENIRRFIHPTGVYKFNSAGHLSKI